MTWWCMLTQMPIVIYGGCRIHKTTEREILNGWYVLSVTFRIFQGQAFDISHLGECRLNVRAHVGEEAPHKKTLTLCSSYWICELMHRAGNLQAQPPSITNLWDLLNTAINNIIKCQSRCGILLLQEQEWYWSGAGELTPDWSADWSACIGIHHSLRKREKNGFSVCVCVCARVCVFNRESDEAVKTPDVPRVRV